MDEETIFTNDRQTINPVIDVMVNKINTETEPILKMAINEFGFRMPLSFRIYNQVRFYEEYGKLSLKVSVASKETLAKQFGVTVKQVDQAFDNLSNKYNLGKWVNHDVPVYRNVTRTWVSNARYKRGFKYYDVTPEVLHGNTKSITAEHLASEVRPLSESKMKVSESKVPVKPNELNTGSVSAEHETFFKQPKQVKQKQPKPKIKTKAGFHEMAQAKEVCNMFTQMLGGEYYNNLNLPILVPLLKNHGFDRVKVVAEYWLSRKKVKFEPEVNKPADLGDHWPKLVEIMENPKPVDSKDGWT
jgi:hypothetical protein